jgi:valyl-tRNA synthetase
VVPFVTEEIWQQLPSRPEGAFLATASWPVARSVDAPARAREFDLVREAVGAVRQIRAEYAVPPGQSIEAFAISANGGSAVANVFAEEGAIVERLSRASLRVVATAPAGASAHAVLTGGASLVVPLAGLVDVDKECARLKGEVESLEKQLAALEGRLANEKFVAKAPAQVVDAERQRLAEGSARRQQLRDKIRSLCG